MLEYFCVLKQMFLKFRDDQTQAKRVRTGLHQVTWSVASVLWNKTEEKWLYRIAQIKGKAVVRWLIKLEGNRVSPEMAICKSCQMCYCNEKVISWLY